MIFPAVTIGWEEHTRETQFRHAVVLMVQSSPVQRLIFYALARWWWSFIYSDEICLFVVSSLFLISSSSSSSSPSCVCVRVYVCSGVIWRFEKTRTNGFVYSPPHVVILVPPGSFPVDLFLERGEIFSYFAWLNHYCSPRVANNFSHDNLLVQYWIIASFRYFFVLVMVNQKWNTSNRTGIY